MKELHFEIIDSTNKYIKEHFQELDDLTFVSSDYQSSGKGRYERKWISPKGENLLFSLLIKNKDIISYGGFLSLVTAVSTSELLTKYGFNNVSIKWPNDVYISDKKVCGILLEGQMPEYIVIGVGINVNQKEIEGEYRAAPTSLFIEGQKEVVLSAFRRDMFDILIKNIQNINQKYDDFLDYFNSHNYLKNKDVSISYNGEDISGIVKGVNKDFHLIIGTKKGDIEVTSGECSVII